MSNSNSSLGSAAAVVAAAAAVIVASERTSATNSDSNSDDHHDRLVEEAGGGGGGGSEADRRADNLKGLKEFAQQYLSDNSARNGQAGPRQQPSRSGLPRGSAAAAAANSAGTGCQHSPLVRTDSVGAEARQLKSAAEGVEAGPAVAGAGEEQDGVGDSEGVRGAEALLADSETEDLDNMPPTIREVFTSN